MGTEGKVGTCPLGRHGGVCQIVTKRVTSHYDFCVCWKLLATLCSTHQLNRRKEQMKRALEQQQRELNEKRRQFDEDKRLFDEEHQKYMEELEASMRSAPPSLLSTTPCSGVSSSSLSLCRAGTAKKDKHKKK